MSTDCTFESVCKIVKDGYPELASDVDAFLNIALTAGVATLAIPIAAASAATILTPALITLMAIGTLSNLFGVKNEIFKVGQRIISKITSGRSRNVHDQYILMQHVYILICYAAFFETLANNKQLAPLIKKIKIKRGEKISTAIMASKDLWDQPSNATDNNEITQDKLATFKYEIAMPQPGDTFKTQRQRLTPLYEQLAGRVAAFLNLEIIKPHIQSEREVIERILMNLPGEALNTFVEQYNMLAIKFPEFAVWLNLQKDDKIIQLTEQSRQLIEEISQVEQQQTNLVLRSLANHYKSIVSAPIIDDPDSGLTYPKKRDIFILQSFKVTHYRNAEQLKESFWNSLPERDDLEIFLSAYFNHEECCTKTPLIILGQPGSGKSLLTSMIAAQLIPLPFTPIRIELRHTNAEDPISTQIEGQIRRDTDRNFDWTTLRDHTTNGPALVLFDGYDELLQATGQVFSGYLNQIKEFQMRQLALSDGEQSVRAVVTSRFTLIDKAVIPPGSTVIRLLEFDTNQQKQWIDKWNDANTSYFQQSQIEPFKLPQNYKNIMKLAEQPLLLMMLAVYYSINNPLSKAASDLDQSLLYDRLLRRFIERELQKNKESAQSWQEYELDSLTDHEMERLGVAAMGMFNRHTVSIRDEELDSDLRFFGLEESSLEAAGYEHPPVIGKMGRQLLPSEKLFGSFFFQKLESVRKTEETMKDGDRNALIRPDDRAYEFLHNTFGEFLTADFMLRIIFEKTGDIRDQINKKSAKGRGFPRSATSKIDLATFDKTWYARFMYEPLFSRPEALKLLREWSQHYIKREDRDTREFLEDFDNIITNHISILLSDNNLPTLMTSDQRHFVALSTVGYIAIYTLNLLLLRTFLDQSTDGYTFDEANYTRSENGTRPWDRLTYLWRSWFSLETLKQLAAILQTERDSTKLHLSIRKNSDPGPSRDRLNLVYSVSQTLADNITAGLSGLLLHDAFGRDNTELDEVVKWLNTENIDKNINAYILMKRLRNIQTQRTIKVEEILKVFYAASLEHTLQLNHEFAASLYKEMSNVLYYLIQEKGVEVALNVFSYVAHPPVFEGPEALELASFLAELKQQVEHLNKNLLAEQSRPIEQFDRESLQLIQWFFEENILKYSKELGVAGNEIQTVRDLKLYAKVIKTALKYGFWSMPDSVGIKKLHRIASGKKRLPMKFSAALINLAREVGDKNILDFIYQYYFKSMMTPEETMSIDLATELVKLMREKNDRRIFSYFVDYLKKELYKKNSLIVELTFEVLKYAREIGDIQVLTQILEEYLKILLSTNKRTPVAFTIELLRFSYEIDDQQLIDSLNTYICRIIKTNTYIQPELILEILKFTNKVKNGEVLEAFKNNYLTETLRNQNLVSVELAVEITKLALESREHDWMEIESFYHQNITLERCYLSLLSIDTIADLRQLVQIFGDNVLLKKINKRLNL
jgi:hypothetical protein